MQNTELNKNSEEQVVNNTSDQPNPLEDEQSDSQETVTTSEKTEVKDGVSDENVETEDKDTQETAETQDLDKIIGERSPGKTDREI
ncbi:MAG: hypothetical protein F6K41_20850 [Symploca sp. SIO3E6]|nr:hypothetical protein [Caldora sp. SIO3E6]